MTHVVCQACFGCKYTDCVVVCPVECFSDTPSDVGDFHRSDRLLCPQRLDVGRAQAQIDSQHHLGVLPKSGRGRPY